MCTKPLFVVAALVLISGAARAQETSGQRDTVTPASAPHAPGLGFANRIDFGVRGTAFDSNADEARFGRYRDLRDGGFLDTLRFKRETDRWVLGAEADRVGYRDERFSAAYNEYGKIKATFEWNQTPLFYSQDTSWLYTDQGGGVLRISNTAVRTGIQSGTVRVADVKRYLGSPFDLRQRRDVAAFGLTASVRKDVDLKVNVTSTRKHGEMPWGASFGFSAANEVSAPIDHRTNDIGASAEWANGKGMVRLGYEGSWFRNSIPTLVFDSPFKVTDSTNPTAYVSGNGASQGRSAMWPDSTAHTVSAAAAYNLPRRSRVNGAVSIGEWNQNESLLPFTINTAIPAIPLDRPTAEAEARITSFNVNFNSRPTDLVWFNVRARRYDFDNRTPEFHVTNYVRLDQVIEPSLLGHTEPFGYVRNYFDADASLTPAPIPFTALKVGYGFEKVDRTFRYLESTTEHTFRTALDTTGNPYVTLRVAYEHAKRSGSGFDEEVLDDIGEQISLRQFDISDRNRNRVTALVQVTPVSDLAVIASAQVGRDIRPDANFGLRRLNTNTYSIGFDATPTSTVGVGLTYTYEDAGTNQKSRQASPGVQFDDPRRDWFTDMTEKVHYIVANVDLVRTIPKTEVRFAVDWNRSNADYGYTLAPNTTLSPVVPLPTVYNELQRTSVDFKYFLTSHLAVGGVYWYENFTVDDFALSPTYVIGNQTLADGIMLGYFLRPYRAHTGWFRLTYLW